jgi:DNA-binding NarL/FixJ family response regulator
VRSVVGDANRFLVATLSDDLELRGRVAALLTGAGFEVGTLTSDAEEIVDGDEPDCIVVCEAEGEVSIRHLRAALPATPIVSITQSAGRRTVVDKLDAGADGIVLEGQVDAQLAPAIRAVSSGQLSLPRDLRSAFSKPRLSPREKQILAMVVMAYTNREIANTLYLAESTVKTHLSSAFEKLGVRSRSEAAALILDSSQGLGTGILSIVGEDAAVTSPAP